MAEEEYPVWAGEGMWGGYPGRVELTISRPKTRQTAHFTTSLKYYKYIFMQFLFKIRKNCNNFNEQKYQKYTEFSRSGWAFVWLIHD